MPTVEPPPLSVDDRTDLAELLAHPSRRPFALDADNEHAGQLPGIAEAVATEAAYVITVAPDVLAIDVDDPDALQALNEYRDAITEAGYPVLLTDSGRIGHRHLWAVIPDKADRDRFTALAVWTGLPAPRSTMRPPGTPHRLYGSGAVRLLDDPDAFRAAVVAIRPTPPPARRPGGRGPGLNWRNLLTTGAWPPGWTHATDDAAMTCRICHGAIDAGYDLDTVRRWLADPNNQGGRAYQRRLTRRGSSQADAWLDRFVWPKAQQYAARGPITDRAGALEYAATFRAAVEAHTWTGLAGASERAALLAYADKAERLGIVAELGMSCRELAEAARFGKDTASNVNRRLVAAGWLQRMNRGRGRTVTDDEGNPAERADGTLWRLLIPVSARARLPYTGHTPPGPIGPSVWNSRAVVDVARARGIGQNGPRVLDALTAGPMTARELADTLELSLGNLRARLLRKLETLELIIRDADTWRLVDDLDAALERAAETLGLTGKAQRDATAHAFQRDDYLEYRTATRPEREERAKAKATADRRQAAERHAAGRAELDARRTDTPEHPQLWPEHPATSPVDALDVLPPTLAPPPPPDPVEAATAPLTGSGRGHAN